VSFIINLLNKGLDGAFARQKALANNVANASTPNYKRQDVDFISILKRQQGEKSSLPMKTTQHTHLSGSNFKEGLFSSFVLQNNTSYRNDKNNVDIEVEMAEVAKNALYYNTLTRQMDEEFSILRNVINKGGGA
jgi:flagellar basal-body rod protein FlgB